mmetsp:Transcript_57246/g.91013  ORF Transcript_57246/g.91013 Transcript_57246/m.91013 type:complete len:276 (-) Transcript_57246:75-902(-)
MVVDSEEDDEDRADLAAQVKRLQRDSEEGKQQWWAFCDSEGYSNRRDPNKHSLDFLRRFFALRREGVLPVHAVSLAPQNEPDPEMHKVWVQRIKQSQRSSQEMKTWWETFCDEQGAGVRDPQRHTCDFMQRFFDEAAGYADGRRASWNASGGAWAGWSPEAAWAQFYAQWGGNAVGPAGMPGAWPQPMHGGMWGPYGNAAAPLENGRKSRSRSRQRSRESGSTSRSSSRSSSTRKVKKKKRKEKKSKKERRGKDKKRKTKKKKRRRSTSSSSSGS